MKKIILFLFILASLSYTKEPKWELFVNDKKFAAYIEKNSVFKSNSSLKMIAGLMKMYHKKPYKYAGHMGKISLSMFVFNCNKKMIQISDIINLIDINDVEVVKKNISSYDDLLDLDFGDPFKIKAGSSLLNKYCRNFF